MKEEAKWKKYLMITLVISILLGILLPLAPGVKNLTLIAICFSSVKKGNQ